MTTVTFSIELAALLIAFCKPVLLHSWGGMEKLRVYTPLLLVSLASGRLRAIGSGTQATVVQNRLGSAENAGHWGGRQARGRGFGTRSKGSPRQVGRLSNAILDCQSS